MIYDEKDRNNRRRIRNVDRNGIHRCRTAVCRSRQSRSKVCLCRQNPVQNRKMRHKEMHSMRFRKTGMRTKSCEMPEKAESLRQQCKILQSGTCKNLLLQISLLRQKNGTPENSGAPFFLRRPPVLRQGTSVLSPGHQIKANASPRAAMISSICSSPMDRRINSG